MSPFSRVLAVTDDTVNAKPALRKAVQFANHSHANLTMLRVHLPEGVGMGRWLQQLVLPRSVSQQRQKQSEYPDKAMQLLLKHCQATTLADAIREELALNDYDLLILQHHQYSALRCEWGHTQDWQLLQQVGLPVLFVSDTPWDPAGKLLTALEVDDEAEPHQCFNQRLLDISHLIANMLGMELHLLSCYQDSDLSMSFGIPAMSHHQRVEQQWLRLQSTAAPLALADRRLHLAAGLPEHMVPEVARQWHSSLVVMGTYEHADLLSDVKGRASEQLLNHLSCDVMAIKPANLPLH